MALWKKLWLLFAVIWFVVAAIQAGTILAFSPEEQEKALRPIVIGVAVPALLYGVGWLWQRFRKKPTSRLPPPPEK
jgi:membrane protein DedA with SNARE-associated domain